MGDSIRDFSSDNLDLADVQLVEVPNLLDATAVNVPSNTQLLLLLGQQQQQQWQPDQVLLPSGLTISGGADVSKILNLTSSATGTDAPARFVDGVEPSTPHRASETTSRPLSLQAHDLQGPTTHAQPANLQGSVSLLPSSLANPPQRPAMQTMAHLSEPPAIPPGQSGAQRPSAPSSSNVITLQVLPTCGVSQHASRVSHQAPSTLVSVPSSTSDSVSSAQSLLATSGPVFRTPAAAPRTADAFIRDLVASSPEKAPAALAQMDEGQSGSHAPAATTSLQEDATSGEVVRQIETPKGKITIRKRSTSREVEAAASESAAPGTSRKVAAAKLWQNAMKTTALAVKAKMKRRLNLTEKERTERRRKQNRQAARKCRLKRVANHEQVEKDFEKLQDENNQYRNEVRQLKEELCSLQKTLTSIRHSNECPLRRQPTPS